MKIKIYTTGGNIDKVYFDRKSNYQVGDPQDRGDVLKKINNLRTNRYRKKENFYE
jgi:hypothetical protein